MTNKLFAICLIISLICEYYWMRHGYRSLVLVASKCPKSSIQSHIPVHHMNNQIDSISTWFSNIFITKAKPVEAIVCDTYEIHTDPRAVFILIKIFCLICLTYKLISKLKTIPTLISTFKNSHLVLSMPNGDGLIQTIK